MLDRALQKERTRDDAERRTTESVIVQVFIKDGWCGLIVVPQKTSDVAIFGLEFNLQNLQKGLLDVCKNGNEKSEVTHQDATQIRK